MEKILPRYEKFARITTKLNRDAKAIKDNFKMPIESRSRKALRCFITLFGALMFSGWACYAAYGFLGASLLATGWGGAVVAAVIISSLVYYFLMQAKGVNDMINPTMELSGELNKQIKDFKVKEQEDFTLTLDKENIYKKYKAVDMALTHPVAEAALESKHTPTLVTETSRHYGLYAAPSVTKQPSLTDDKREIQQRFRSKSFSY